jgi:hypothetical protein
MASAISYELFLAKQGTANGLATLDSSSKIPVSQLPTDALETYKGQYDDYAALIVAYPTGTLADYAYVTDTSSYWYWNAALATPAWVNQEITEAAYISLSAAEKAAVPYIVEP